jgi:hypothetical protein
MYTVGAIISGVFFLLGLLQSKFSKEKTDLKKLIKQTIVVFVSSLVGITIAQQMSSSNGSSTKTPSVFIDNPNF